MCILQKLQMHFRAGSYMYHQYCGIGYSGIYWEIKKNNTVSWLLRLFLFLSLAQASADPQIQKDTPASVSLPTRACHTLGHGWEQKWSTMHANIPRGVLVMWEVSWGSLTLLPWGSECFWLSLDRSNQVWQGSRAWLSSPQEALAAFWQMVTESVWGCAHGVKTKI